MGDDSGGDKPTASKLQNRLVAASSWRMAFTSGKKRRAEKDAVLHLAQAGRLFGFENIWSMKHDEKGSRLAICATATCPPNELMAQKIHDRIPTILGPGARDR
jgi:putative SOS response-associated peptidase YedK